MELIIILAFVALFIAARSAHSKINRLEERLDQLTKTQTVTRPEQSEQSQQTTEFTPTTATEKIPLHPIPVPSPTAEPYESKRRPFELDPTHEPEPFFLYTWFKEHTLIKIGSIIFFLGAAWFVTYAFDQNWIPPIVRVLMGLMLGIVVYGVGAAREAHDKQQYAVLTALGSAIVFVTVLAAQFSFSEPLLSSVVSLFVLVVAITYTVFAALRTDAEWLAVAAAVAALFAPQFSGSDATSVTPLFLYLFAISAGLGGVVLFTAWRYVTLTMVGGVSVYALMASGVESQLQLTWLFVIAFSLLFLTLTSVSIIRNRIPLITDGLTLLLTGLLYVYFVHTVAAAPALAMFSAAAVTAVIGYLARLREVTPAAVLLYAVCSIVGIFAGTAYLFDGVTATFFFAIESAALIYLAMRLAFLEKTIYLATSTLALPLCMGLLSLRDTAWDTGVIHPAALAVVTVSVCTALVGIYMYATATRTQLLWLRTIASTVLALWYGYTVVMLLVIARTLATLSDTSVAIWATALLLLHALALLGVSLARHDQVAFRTTALWSLVLPVGFACAIMADATTRGQFMVAELLVLSLVLVSLIMLTITYARLAAEHRTSSDRVAWYSLLWVSVGFVGFWMTSVFDTLFSPEIAVTVSAVFFTALCYGVINLLLRVRLDFGRILPFIVILALPTVALLPAFDYSSWVGGAVSIDAVSLYVHITMLALLARTLFSYNTMCHEADRPAVHASATALVVGSGVLSFILIWSLSHAVLDNAVIAVTVALFVYTIAGLSLYVYGKRTARDMYTRAGYALLVVVVLRLGLVDVWAMEPFWRIVTFLGIGALFIIAALLERGGENTTTADQKTQSNSEI